MVTICVIDDQKEYLDVVEQEIKAIYSNVEVIKLTSYNHLLLQDKKIDLFILDVDMQGINGIDLALLLKKSYPYVEFVFISAHNDLIHDSLLVRPIYFIRKDHLLDDFKVLFKLLDLNKYEKKLILSDINKIERCININNIVYVEIKLHSLTIYLDNNEYTFNCALKELIEKVKDSCLIQIHKSFLVNLNKIDKIKGNDCFMSERITIPIGRKYRAEFIEAYRNYL